MRAEHSFASNYAEIPGPTATWLLLQRGVIDDLRTGLQGVRDEIRDKVQGVRDEVQGVSQRLDRLERRQTEAEMRVAMELIAVGGAVREMRDAFLGDHSLRTRVEDHERRLAAIEKHAG